MEIFKFGDLGLVVWPLCLPLDTAGERARLVCRRIDLGAGISQGKDATFKTSTHF
jgi:hypothetical protein